MSVAAFVAYLNDTFKAIWDVNEAAVEGEVSGYRVSQGQWVSFDLKDNEALVNVFLPVWKQSVPIEDGMRVRVFGWPRIYPKYGKFSLSAEKIELAGEGALRKALAMLRLKLEQEGLFDLSRKRALPRFPKRIALIASKESAAYGDFIRIVNERWGGLDIDLYHVLVQGERAPEQIVRAIQTAQNLFPPYQGGTQGGSVGYDALVLTRGGGSFDELMAFNDERVVRAIHGCKIPTLVAIGHERDLTLAEEAADVRGSTPTDCARRLVPDRAEILFALSQYHDSIASSLDQWIHDRATHLDQAMLHARHWLQDVLSRFEAVSLKAIEGFDRWRLALADRIQSVSRLFRSFDPRSVIQRGYAIVRDASGSVVTSVKALRINATAEVQLRDGSAETLVQSIKQKLL